MAFAIANTKCKRKKHKLRNSRQPMTWQNTDYGYVCLPRNAKLPKFHLISDSHTGKLPSFEAGDFVVRGRDGAVARQQTGKSKLSKFADEVLFGMDAFDREEFDWCEWACDVSIWLDKMDGHQLEPLACFKLSFNVTGYTSKKVLSTIKAIDLANYERMHMEIDFGKLNFSVALSNRVIQPEWQGRPHWRELKVCRVYTLDESGYEWHYEPLTSKQDFEQDIAHRRQVWRCIEFEDWRHLEWLEKRNANTSDSHENVVVPSRHIIRAHETSAEIAERRRLGHRNVRAGRCVDVYEVVDALPNYIFRCNRERYANWVAVPYFKWQFRIPTYACLRWAIYQQILVELSVPLLSLIYSPYCIMWILEWLENFGFTNWTEYIRINTIQRVFDSIRRIEEKREREIEEKSARIKTS